MGLLIVAAPAIEPITLAEAKSFLRVDGNEEDTLIEALITAARQTCELFTGQAFIDQTWDYYLDQARLTGPGPWWDGEREGTIDSLFRMVSGIDLPLFPVSSITEVTTTNELDEESVFGPTNYRLERSKRPCRVALKTGASWPSGLRATESIRIRFVAGYGAAASDVPATIRQAMKMLVAHLFEHREPVAVGTIVAQMPLSVATLLQPFCRVGI